MDNVGNVARYTSETTRVVGDALPRPTVARLNASALNVSASVAVVDVQWSTDELFKKASSLRSVQSPVMLQIGGRLADAQVFVRVSEPGAESWSVPTKAWVTTEDCETNTCGTSQYLDEKSDDPSEWTCRNCPEGSRCHGAVIWSDVKAQVGWRRIAGPAPQSFQPCVQLAVEGKVGSLSGTVEWVCDEAMPEWARWQILHDSSIVASGEVLASTHISESLAPATYQLRVMLEGSSSELDIAYGSNRLRSQATQYLSRSSHCPAPQSCV